MGAEILSHRRTRPRPRGPHPRQALGCLVLCAAFGVLSITDQKSISSITVFRGCRACRQRPTRREDLRVRSWQRGAGGL